MQKLRGDQIETIDGVLEVNRSQLRRMKTQKLLITYQDIAFSGCKNKQLKLDVINQELDRRRRANAES